MWQKSKFPANYMASFIRSAPVAIAVALVIGLPVFSATYYVSTLGDDTNNGSLGAPFKTIQKAAGLMVAGDVCLIRGGTYRETVTPLNSGSSTNRITYKAYAGEKVIISGADVITGWTQYSGNIYRASMSWTLGKENQVFVNDTMAFLARWPNVADPVDVFNFGSYSTAKTGSGSGHVYDNQLPSKPDNYWQGCVLWGNFGAKWTAYGVTISSSSGQDLYFTQPNLSGWYATPNEILPWGTWLTATNKEAYFLSGKLELLDTLNEWYCDETNHYLYIWVNGGGNPGNKVQAKHRGLAINLASKSYITFQGISTFSASNSMMNSTYCILDSMNMKYLTHSTMAGSTYNLNFTNGVNGVAVSGSNNKISNSIIRYSAGNGILVNGSNQEIDNNDIQYTSYLNAYNYGINMGGSGPSMRITRNKVWYCGNIGIEFEALGGGTDDAALVFYNDVAFTCLFADDRGGIEGCGAEVAYNWVHDIGRGQAVGSTPAFYTDLAQDYVTYHHNVAWNINGLYTMFLINNTGNANGNVGIYIYNNTSYNVPGGVIIQGHNMWTQSNNAHNPVATNFVNAAGKDFRPSSTSSLINVGVVVTNPYAITSGYFGSAPEKGAYEYGGADAVSNWTAGLNSTSYYLGNGQWNTTAIVPEKKLHGVQTSAATAKITEKGCIVSIPDQGPSCITVSDLQGRVIMQREVNGPAQVTVVKSNFYRGVSVLTIKRRGTELSKKITYF